jgi:hypothetical protein
MAMVGYAAVDARHANHGEEHRTPRLAARDLA